MTDLPVRQPQSRPHVDRSALQHTVEHTILLLIIGAAIGCWITLQVIAHQDSKTQAAVRDALRAVPVAQAAPAPSKN